MTCPVCERPTTAGDHGACVERLVTVLKRLQEMLVDAGALSREAVAILRQR